MLRRVLMICMSSAVLWSAAQKAHAQGALEQKAARFEHEWARASVKGDAAAIERLEAPDFTFTDSNGNVTGRADDIKDLKTGNFRAEAIDLNGLKVRVYGNAAVITGRATLKNCKWHGKDISGDYRFTDVWANANGNWQIVASQSAAVAKQ